MLNDSSVTANVPAADLERGRRFYADVLGLTPVLQLGLDLGEGVNALAALPLLRTAIGLAATLPVHPALVAGHDDGDRSDIVPDGDQDFAEPVPDGPGPARP